MRTFIKLSLFYMLLFSGLTAWSQTQTNGAKGSLNAEIGIWKPSSLDDEPSKPFKNIKGATPTFGLSLRSPDWNSMALRASFYQWKHDNPDNTLDLESTSLRNLSFDLEYYILDNFTVRPYATYGITLLWIQEKFAESHEKQSSFNYTNLGFSVGFGVDLLLLKHWGLGLEYQYLYSKLDEKTGVSDNYSGPKLTCKILFLF